ncbi:MAG: hypothetical protein RBQ91_05930 [Acholeplasma sp.]|nr:hypothetical protein [Acholeplasma sp.]
MTNNQIIIIVILSTILLILLLLSVVFFGKSKYYKYHFQRTQYEAIEFGHLIGISGKIGSGKTSIASGLSHIYQLDIQYRIQKLLKDYQTYFNKIEFQNFNDRLYELIITHGAKNYYLITDELMAGFNLIDRPVYNFMNFTTIREMTKSYVIAFISLLRNNYVASKTRFYSRITNTLNLDYDIKQQDLYKVFESGDYYIEDYLVEIIDEAQDDNSAATWREQETSGRKQYRNKYRHIHEQNNRMIGIKQDETDEVRKQRSLYQTNIKIVEKTDVKFIYRFVYKIFEFCYRLEDSPYRFFKLRLPYTWYYIKNLFNYDKYSFQSYCDARYDSPSITRDVDHKLMFVRWYLESLNYSVFTVQIAHDADDLSKDSKVDNLKLVIPTIYCFTYPRFEFNKIQTDLLEKSNKDGSIERNLFKNPEFFNTEEKVVISDDIEF